MSKISFLLFFLIFSTQAEECSKDIESLKKGGCSINSKFSNAMYIFSESQKEATGITCFKRANVDISKITDTNCEFTSSNSTNTAYYRCDNFQTAVQDCNEKSKSPSLYYFNKPLSEINKVKDYVQEDFFKCFKKSGSSERIDTKLCSFRLSISGNTVYAECGNYNVEIYPCRDEKIKPKLQLNIINNSLGKDDTSRSLLKKITPVGVPVEHKETRGVSK